jgi:hypothetical protein
MIKTPFLQGLPAIKIYLFQPVYGEKSENKKSAKKHMSAN